MRLPVCPRRYTLHIIQQTQAVEPIWSMILVRPDATLVYKATKMCTRAVLVDGLAALARALPGLIIVYDNSEDRLAA